MAGLELQISMSGGVLQAIESLRHISGAEDIEALILRAIYLYREILTEQALGGVICSRKEEESVDLVDLVKDKKLALDFVEYAKAFSFEQDWHLFFVDKESS